MAAVTLHDLAARLDGAVIRGDQLTARCPAHDDHDPSLSATYGDNGALVVYCHAGCETSVVLATVGLSVAQLYDENPRARSTAPKVVARYQYRDENGEPVLEVRRLTPKSFRQYRPDGKGGWLPGAKGVRKVPYRLPEVLAAVKDGDVVFVAEGEKDCDVLVAHGLTATCNAGGAGKWTDDHAAFLAGADVVVIADNDDPGRAHAEKVRASLEGIAATVAVVQAADGKDAAAHFAAGHGISDFVPLLPTVAESRFIDWSTFWERDRTEADWLLEPVLARGRGHSIYAPHKQGKSLFTLWVVLQLIRAGVVVIYCDFEMTEDDVWERLVDMGCGPDTDLSRLRYWLLPVLSPLDTAKGATQLLGVIDEVQADFPDEHVAVILDTTSRAVEGPENDADTYQAFYSYTGMALKRRGITYARLDHAGKKLEKGQRGSSAKGDDVDLVWELTRNQDGITLKRHLTRIRWAPEKVLFTMTEDPLDYVRAEEAWPAGTAECAAELDALGVPEDTTVRDAQAALKAAEKGARREIVGAAVRWRKAGTAAGTARRKTTGTAAGTATPKPRNDRPEPGPEPSGTDELPYREPGPPPKGGPVLGPEQEEAA